MTPYQLLGIVAVIAVVRVALTVRPVAVASNGRTLSVAREYLDPFIFAGVAAWFLITFIARTYYIPSESMVPTLKVSDVLLVDKIAYRVHKPSEGDVVVFVPPIPSPDDFIKRVIGTPGDNVRIRGGTVYVNGIALTEPYIAQKPFYDLEIRNYGIYVNDGAWHALDPGVANIPPKSQWTAPDRIPPHCYLMLGDNRNNSDDSHLWGFAQDTGTFATGPRAGEHASFTGHAFVVFWPFTQARILHV